jgi:hypothetical protein
MNEDVKDIYEICSYGTLRKPVYGKLRRECGISREPLLRLMGLSHGEAQSFGDNEKSRELLKKVRPHFEALNGPYWRVYLKMLQIRASKHG